MFFIRKKVWQNWKEDFIWSCYLNYQSNIDRQVQISKWSMLMLCEWYKARESRTRLPDCWWSRTKSESSYKTVYWAWKIWLAYRADSSICLARDPITTPSRRKLDLFRYDQGYSRLRHQWCNNVTVTSCFESICNKSAYATNWRTHSIDFCDK